MDLVRRLHHWWRMSGRWQWWLFLRSFPQWTRWPIRKVKLYLRWAHLVVTRTLATDVEELPADTRLWFSLRLWRARNWWTLAVQPRWAAWVLRTARWWKWHCTRRALRVSPKWVRWIFSRTSIDWSLVQKNAALAAGRWYERLHRGRFRAVALAIAVHIRAWLVLLTIGVALSVLHHVQVWRYWSRTNLQALVDEARSWLPSAWAMWLKQFPPRVWVTLAICAGVLMVVVPIALAFLVAWRHRRHEEHWMFEVRHARVTLQQLVMQLGASDDDRVRTEALRLLLKFREGLVYLLPELPERGEALPPALGVPSTVRGWALLAAALPEPDDHLLSFLRRYRGHLSSQHEGWYILGAYFQSQNAELHFIDPEHARIVLLRDLEGIRARFQDAQWLAKHAS